MDETLVAGVSDGTAVLLNPVASLIWDALEHWRAQDELVVMLAHQFPDVGHVERSDAVHEALDLLNREDLLEHADR